MNPISGRIIRVALCHLLIVCLCYREQGFSDYHNYFCCECEELKIYVLGLFPIEMFCETSNENGVADEFTITTEDEILNVSPLFRQFLSQGGTRVYHF